MCTKRESRLFIDTINNIPAKESIELEEEFPVKDRSASRKHNSSRRKAKEKNRIRKETAYQRSANLYNAGLDRNGQTFKARSVEMSASLDERDFLKGDTNPTETANRTDNNDCFSVFSNYRDTRAVCEKLANLYARGITLSRETEQALINKMKEKDYVKLRSRELINEREIVGYTVYYYSSWWSEGKVSGFPTEKLANDYVNALIKEGYDAYLSPIKMFSEEQAKEFTTLLKATH